MSHVLPLATPPPRRHAPRPLVSLLCGALACGDPAAAAQASGTAPQHQDLRGIDVSYKLDPRLTRGLYMGDRWVSPPVFRLNPPGNRASVEVRVEGVDASGQRRAIRPRWSTPDAPSVTVMPAEGSEVRIVVEGAGERRLRVSADGVSKDLFVRAAEKGDAISVEILQVPPPGTAAGDERARLLASGSQPSYAFGVDLGRRLEQRPPDVDVDRLARELEDQPPTGTATTLGQALRRSVHAVSAELDAGFVALGVRDGLTQGQALLSEKELQSALVELRMQSLDRDRRRLAEQNRQEGEAYLAQNALREGVVTLPSGLQYRALETGDGPRPGPYDTVLCHYRGTFVDGTEFDSTLGRGRPAVLPLKRVIRGFRDALRLMPVGSRWQLFVPPDLAYGERGARGTIGPNATLVFELELVSIRDKSQAHRRHPEATDRRTATKDETAAP